jgi:lipoprotein-releasing system permease protein
LGKGEKDSGRAGKKLMNKFRFSWIGFVASRYVGRGRKNSPAPVLAILGIATGVLALIVILAVMNGFQLGFIESILEISSYHIRLENFDMRSAGLLEEEIMKLPGIGAAVPFREFQGLARGKRGGQQAALVRGLKPDAIEKDPGFAARLDFEEGGFDITGDRDILLGSELARRLGVHLGDEVNIFSIPSILAGSGGEEDAAAGFFRVRGVFRTGFYEYDLGWAYININSVEDISDAAPCMGIKIHDRFRDGPEVERIRVSVSSIAGTEEVKLSSWRDYNRAFFSALRTEKLFMFILVALIFIVVGLNIFQAQRRTVLERREEIGLLRAVGAGERAVRLIFVWDGFLIGFTGACSGLVLGLVIASNIPVFFGFLEAAVNGGIAILNFFFDLAGIGEAGEFAVFSPAVFYLKEIPSRIIAREVVLVYLFGLFSALFAAWFASGKISRTNPAEVLRYE